MARIKTGRPWVTLKLAVSADGMIGREAGGQVAITGPRASTHVHALRSRYDGILVGRGTIKSDDPLLTCRLPGLENRSPVRVVLDTRGHVKADARIFSAADKIASIRIVGTNTASDQMAPVGGHVETIAASLRGERIDLTDAMKQLAAYGLTRVLVEGGAQVAASLVEERLVDDVILSRSPAVIGTSGIPALAGLPLSVLDDEARFKIAGRRRFGEDIMVRYRKVG
jgi:diaminohydroxyphosphoribosylaminopyrimidine deaminase/5-amino-6-(5-phosphoribosylamino)uracil reductase